LQRIASLAADVGFGVGRRARLSVVAQRFEVAPWSTSVKAVSVLATLVLAGVALLLLRAVPRGTRVPLANSAGSALVAVPCLILLVALLFVVTGYELDAGVLRVRRLLWSTSMSLAGLDRAWHDPAVTRRSIRIFGNGGLFSVTGLFQNAALGRYRAFLTDPARAVVLHDPSRTVVVSPAHPEAFLEGLRMLFPSLGGGPG
jgi:hypothetical protein